MWLDYSKISESGGYMNMGIVGGETDGNRDPVCGMGAGPLKNAGRHTYKGREYYFCSKHCLEKFKLGPEQYLGGQSVKGKGQKVEEGGIYICPMHPEVRQVGAGAFPKCGMGLEGEMVNGKGQKRGEENPELVYMAKRFWVSVVLAVPIVVIAMGQHLFGHGANEAMIRWLEFGLATPAVVWCGWPFFVRGWQSIINRSLNMFTLIAAGVGVAYVYSAIAMAWPGVFPAGFRKADGGVDVYFEPAAVITALVLMGQVLELRARRLTGGAIRALL